MGDHNSPSYMIPNNLQTINSLSLSDTPDILNVLNSDQDQPSTAILPNTQSIIPTTSIATNSAFSTPSFEDSLSNASLPPPGPSYYAARRALWLNPTPGHPLPQVPSTSRQKLEQLLSAPGAVESEETWKSGIERVWKGLVTGEKLKRRLPMNLVIKIIHAGWLRDPETWPLGAVAPEPDDVLEDSATFHPNGAMSTEYSSGVAAPWTAVNGRAEDVGESHLSRWASGIVGFLK